MGIRQGYIIFGLTLLSLHIKAQDSTLLSHRGMNIFLSNTIGYYLSTPNDLTLYKNSVLLNSDGYITINHNLRQPTGHDDPIKAFTTIGIRANARYPETNQLGAFLKQTWLSNTRTRSTPDQKSTMAARRAAIRQIIEADRAKKTPDLAAALNALYPDPNVQYTYDQALLEAEALERTGSYQLITLNWTSASLYAPFLNQQLPTGEHFYPLHANLSHTRFRESTRFGRLYLTVAGDAQINKDFLTPSLNGRFVYLPHNSHFGLSGSLQQNFGPYHATVSTIGLPIVLIDKKAEPACNFEFQVRFNDPASTKVAVT
ncbi:MAG TPA: hypothetical protein VI233_16790, partial [Puia sp.]